MATINEPDIRTLSYYSQQYPHRVMNPETLDFRVPHGLLLRIPDASEEYGAAEYPVVLQSVQKLQVGSFAVNLVFMINRKPYLRRVGEMFDGVWTPSKELRVQNHKFPIRLVDGIFVDQNLPGASDPSLAVSRELDGSLELAGV